MTNLRTPFRAALAPALAVTALLALPTAASASSAPAAVDGACTDPTGVTVVVDLTDLGGEVEVGCAQTPATGTEALAAAGFAETRDAAGMICAIDALPDPCPATFEGSYWSYWYAEPGGEWQTYMEGSDTAVPVAGNVEGWRYSDGSEGPGIAAPALAEGAEAEETVAPEATTVPEEAADATEEPAETATMAPTDQDPAQPGPSPALLAGLGLLGLLVVAAVMVARRRAASGHGPAGQD